ncbi:diguanylate cyclase [Spirochaetia bacterium]|nr:diguanylate cyclase [Spirochaetia bacterium]
MKEFVTFAKYNKDGDKTIYGILDKLSNDEREKGRGSFYGSVSSLYRHALSGTIFFLGMYKEALKGNPAVEKALAPLEGISLPKEQLTEAQWKDLAAVSDTIDDAYINLVSALSDSDLNAPLKINWYGGNPAEVPLSFMLSQLVMHGTHHRGQISQILDELKIDNDYSGIQIANLIK